MMPYSMLIQIFKTVDGDLAWVEVEDAEDGAESNWLYVVDDGSDEAIVHESRRSALYDDIEKFKDYAQHNERTRLRDNELYVVLYYAFVPKYGGYLEQFVDFGVTKEEIIENVSANKYTEGASYHTLGSVMKTTKDALEGKIEGIE